MKTDHVVNMIVKIELQAPLPTKFKHNYNSQEEITGHKPFCDGDMIKRMSLSAIKRERNDKYYTNDEAKERPKKDQEYELETNDWELV